MKYEIPAEAEERLPAPDSRTGRLTRWLLQRFPVWNTYDHLEKKVVPKHRHSVWYNMGGLALFFFTVQVITGILLMVYYRPAEPWMSVQRIVMEIPFGALIRSIHHWSANLMTLTLFLHLFSTFFMKAYREPREFTWLSGALLFALVLVFGFSGYLLPWDDLAFFATRVGIAEVEKAPLLGVWLADLARGGPEVTVDTIGRFYTLHVMVLPVTILTIIGLHLFFIQVQGVSEPDFFASLPPEKKRYEKFFSEFLLSEIPIWLCMGALLLAISAVWPRGLTPEADPFGPAPVGIKPEWYFLSQFQLLKLFPGRIEAVGMFLWTMIPLGILAVPFLDSSIPADDRGRLVTKIGVVALLGLVIFTLWGWIS